MLIHTENVMHRFMPRPLLTLLTLLTVAPVLALAEIPLTVEDPWTPEAPPGRMMAGFMLLHNPGESDVALVDATSPGFGHVEIHTMVMDDGVMRMRRLDELVIPAGETVELRPGGLHLMLIEPLESFSQGDQIEVELIDDQGRRLGLQSEVRSRTRPDLMD